MLIHFAAIVRINQQSAFIAQEHIPRHVSEAYQSSIE